MSNLLYKNLSYQIQGAFFNVYRQLGNPFKEIIYQNALLEEFRSINLTVECQKRINVYYRNKKVGAYVPDFVINNAILIEIKSKPKLLNIDIQQFWYYLKGSDYKVGYLVNFGSAKRVEYIRRVYDTARKNQ